MTQITNSYNALRSLLDGGDEKGTIRVNEFTESLIDNGVYRFIVDRVDWHCGGETITVEYKIEESKNGLWVEAFGRAPKKSIGKQNEFVKLQTGEVVSINEAKETVYLNSENLIVLESEALTEGVLNEGYTVSKSLKEGFDTSYNHVLLTLGLRDQLLPLVDMFVKMNLDTKELTKYKNV